MRTAIFVYKATSISISTSEVGLQLCCMGSAPVPLSAGSLMLPPGIYKIVSDDTIQVAGDISAFEFIAEPNNKTSIPTPPPSRAAVSFAPLDVSALQDFFAITDAKVAVNP
jgi:hypothetical protein